MNNRWRQQIKEHRRLRPYDLCYYNKSTGEIIWVEINHYTIPVFNKSDVPVLIPPKPDLNFLQTHVDNNIFDTGYPMIFESYDESTNTLTLKGGEISPYPIQRMITFGGNENE